MPTFLRVTSAGPCCARPRFLLFVALALGLSTGCSGPPAAPASRPDSPLSADAAVLQSQGEQGGTLRYSLLDEPSTFNLALVEDVSSRLLATLTTGTLLSFNHKTFSVEPGIARQWEVEEDHRSIRLALRRDLRFSDGHPMDADDVVFTFSRLFEEGSNTPLGATLRMEGKPPLCRKLEDDLVEIEFPQTSAALTFLLTTVPVFPEHLMGDPGKKLEEYWSLGTPPQEMAGLGPFVIDSHEPARETRLRFNPHYWKIDGSGQRLPYLDGISIRYLSEVDTQMLQLEAGELDLLDSSVRASDLRRLKDSGLQTIDAGGSLNLTFWWFNQRQDESLPEAERSWFGNLNFRKATNSALSRRTIVDNLYQGTATAATTLMPPSLPQWYVDVPVPEDLELSKRLLREAGFSWTHVQGRDSLVDPQGRPVAFDIFCLASPGSGRMAAILAQDLERLGMQVSIRQEEFRALISRIMRSGDYSAALLSLDLPYEPADHGNVLFSSSGMHFWNPSQPTPATDWEAEIDRLMLEQMTSLDMTARKRLYSQIQRILADKVPFMPLVHTDVLVLAGPKLRNLHPAPGFPHALWNSWELSF